MADIEKVEKGTRWWWDRNKKEIKDKILGAIEFQTVIRGGMPRVIATGGRELGIGAKNRRIGVKKRRGSSKGKMRSRKEPRQPLVY
jgi:hypothetical protein